MNIVDVIMSLVNEIIQGACVKLQRFKKYQAFGK